MHFLSFVCRLPYNIDWMVKDALSGRIGKKLIVYSLLGFILGGVVSNYPIESERGNDLWGFYKNVEAFFWLALYPFYLYLIKSRLSFLSGGYYFLAALVFFLKYCLFILVYHLLMFFLVLGVALFIDVRNEDFDRVDTLFRYVATGYFYSLFFYFLYKIKILSDKQKSDRENFG